MCHSGPTELNPCSGSLLRRKMSRRGLGAHAMGRVQLASTKAFAELLFGAQVAALYARLVLRDLGRGTAPARAPP